MTKPSLPNYSSSRWTENRLVYERRTESKEKLAWNETKQFLIALTEMYVFKVIA